MKLFEFVKYTLPTGGILVGSELTRIQEKQSIDEFENRSVVFLNSEWIEEDDGTVIKVNDIFVYNNEEVNNVIEKLFDNIGIIYLYGFEYVPSSYLTIKYTIFRPDSLRVKIFSGNFSNIQIEVNAFLTKITNKYRVENVTQSSATYANGVIISVWYKLR